MTGGKQVIVWGQSDIENRGDLYLEFANCFPETVPSLQRKPLKHACVSWGTVGPRF